MCGRFTERSDPDKLARRFHVERSLFDAPPRFNIAPTQTIAAVLVDGGIRTMRGVAWGLVPRWATGASDVASAGIINARAESIHTKPAFRDAFLRRRCLVPADGFYEWRKNPGSKLKTPMFAQMRDGSLFAFAGLWEPAHGDPDSPPTCTIITTEPNALLSPIHNRMPVILDPADEAAWLDPRNDDQPDALRAMLRPCDPSKMTLHAVSRRVNSPRFDDPSLVEPADDPPPDRTGEQGTLFGP